MVPEEAVEAVAASVAAPGAEVDQEVAVAGEEEEEEAPESATSGSRQRTATAPRIVSAPAGLGTHPTLFLPTHRRRASLRRGGFTKARINRRGLQTGSCRIKWRLV